MATYEKKKRRCKNGHVKTEYAWSDQVVLCHCGEAMTEVKPKKVELIGIRTQTKNRV